MNGCLWILLLLASALWGLLSDADPSAKMLLISIWVFMTIKLQALQNWRRTRGSVTVPGMLVWFVMVPVLDASQFFGKVTKSVARPSIGEWLWAASKSVAGLAMLFMVAPVALPHHAGLAGWIAMAGIVFSLHFGLLELIVLAWRRAGYDIQPLMRQPLQAETLSDFWGRRWNTAFRDFAHEQVFRPLCRIYSPHVATLGSFFFSGLIHELAISIPAGGGYGLPTIYFLLQWVGIRLEKHGHHQRWLICRGIAGRIIAASFIIAPCALLFHSAFVLNVIVPFIPNAID